MFDLRKLDAYVVYLILRAAGSLFFALIVTVNLVYQVTVAGLNPLQLVLVGTVLELTAFLGEVIPHGAVRVAMLLSVGEPCQGGFRRIGVGDVSASIGSYGQGDASGKTRPDDDMRQ
ncbi:MAG: hypothetical protein M5U01_04620 [Ardenticatenaceae bacterium]|nr:hypothetical protein [Ardenticatenaceae bacterium]